MGGQSGIVAVMSYQIIINAARCDRCKTAIVSTHRHDFQTCPCGALSVDGGKAYFRRALAPGTTFTDLSLVVKDGTMLWSKDLDHAED